VDFLQKKQIYSLKKTKTMKLEDYLHLGRIPTREESKKVRCREAVGMVCMTDADCLPGVMCNSQTFICGDDSSGGGDPGITDPSIPPVGIVVPQGWALTSMQCMADVNCPSGFCLYVPHLQHGYCLVPAP
jgi:hypothetical protein